MNDAYFIECINHSNLHRKAGMNLKDSMTLIQQKRPQAEPIPAFMTQLQEYEKKCIDLGVFGKDSKHKLDESSESSNQTKRRAIGPAVGPPKPVIGPSLIGPSLPPLVEAKVKEPTTETSRKEDASSCGPLLSNNVGDSVGSGDSVKQHQTSGKVIDHVEECARTK